MSYAVWRYTFTGDANVIDTGEISLEFLESTDVISIENALPITDEQGIVQEEEFDFAVTTKTEKKLYIGYSLYLEKILTKCSDIETPTEETYPVCYFTISEDDKKALIEWMATENDGFFGSTIEEAAQFYDAVVTHDEDKLQSLFIEISDFSYSDASDFADEFKSNGYEEYLTNPYQQLTGKTITVNNEFNGENIIESSKSLDDSEVKIYLTDYEGNVLVGPTKVSDLNSDYFLYEDINIHNSSNKILTDKYKIKVWVDQDTDASNWDENTELEYKFKIGVTEKQERSTTYAVYSWSTSTIYMGDTLDSISDYTTDYTTLGKNYFLKHNIGNDDTVKSNDLCYILNDRLYCLKGCRQYNRDESVCEITNFKENSAILLTSFGEENCYVESDYVGCSLSGLYASARSLVLWE